MNHQLPRDVQERLDELEDLSRKAEEGDADARRQLKRAVRESAPAVIARASDVGRRAQHMLIETVAGGNLLTHYALSGRLDVMREEIAGENPTPLEVLLTERVVACWMLVQLFDVLMAAQLRVDTPQKNRVSFATGRHYLHWQEQANKRFLAAVQALARVRKLQANTPGITVNTQINLRS